MSDPLKRLLRCPRCRIRFESAGTSAPCAVCGTLVSDDDEAEPADEARERAPTMRHAVIPPRKD
jgi:tRNA(Ile2) C34 agmatinyltransferase TiaS